ncbi:hypothetical protein EGW08_007815 [Elysia chlorotica]|uniref:Uncharacterized protein n=1 Tax=Elysia chlorotica TaxID=188477 RepID=A0A3S1BI80_ELYCH|nr:hypothetical protein EGW08_007815 [Elysia chlorotica]
MDNGAKSNKLGLDFSPTDPNSSFTTLFFVLSNQLISYPHNQLILYPHNQLISYPHNQLISYPHNQLISYPHNQLISYPHNQLISYPHNQLISYPLLLSRTRSVLTLPKLHSRHASPTVVLRRPPRPAGLSLDNEEWSPMHDRAAL